MAQRRRYEQRLSLSLSRSLSLSIFPPAVGIHKQKPSTTNPSQVAASKGSVSTPHIRLQLSGPREDVAARRNSTEQAKDTWVGTSSSAFSQPPQISCSCGRYLLLLLLPLDSTVATSWRRWILRTSVHRPALRWRPRNGEWRPFHRPHSDRYLKHGINAGLLFTERERSKGWFVEIIEMLDHDGLEARKQ